MNQSPSPSVAQFGQEASSRKGPACFKLLLLRVTETTCFCDPSTLQKFFCTLPQICASIYAVSEVYRQFLRLHGLVCALTCTVNCGTLYKQVLTFQINLQSTKFTTGELQSSCRNNRMPLSSILSVMAKAVNTYVHVIFFFKNLQISNILLSHCHYVVLFVEF